MAVTAIALVHSVPPEGLTGMRPPISNSPSRSRRSIRRDADEPGRIDGVVLRVAEWRIQFRNMNLLRRIGDASLSVGFLERAAKRIGVGMFRGRVVAHAVAHPVSLRGMASPVIHTASR